MNERRTAFLLFKETGHLAHYIEYNKLSPIAKRLPKQTKRDAWRNFCTSINQNTPIKEAFHFNASISNPPPTIEQLNTFADTQAPAYVPSEQESHPLPSFPSVIPQPPLHTDFLLLPIALIEFTNVTSKKENTAPGQDGISSTLDQLTG